MGQRVEIFWWILLSAAVFGKGGDSGLFFSRDPSIGIQEAQQGAFLVEARQRELHVRCISFEDRQAGPLGYTVYDNLHVNFWGLGRGAGPLHVVASDRTAPASGPNILLGPEGDSSERGFRMDSISPRAALGFWLLVLKPLVDDVRVEFEVYAHGTWLVRHKTILKETAVGSYFIGLVSVEPISRLSVRMGSNPQDSLGVDHFWLGTRRVATCDRSWHIRWFSCEGIRGSGEIVSPDGTPFCGSTECPPSGEDCWGAPAVSSNWIEPDIAWSVDRTGVLELSTGADTVACGFMEVELKEAKRVILPAEGDRVAVWLNQESVEIVEGKASLELRAGWNRIEWTTPGESEVRIGPVEIPCDEKEWSYLSVAVNPPGAGSVDPPCGDHRYLFDTTVDIRARADECFLFDHWEGGVADDRTNPENRVILDSDRVVITAVFRPRGEEGMDLRPRVDIETGTVELTWRDPEGCDGVEVLRNGLVAARLGGDRESWRESENPPFPRYYRVRALRNGEVVCTSEEKLGTLQIALLTDSATYRPTDQGTIEAVFPVNIYSVGEIQGFSFGVSYDPEVCRAKDVRVVGPFADLDVTFSSYDLEATSVSCEGEETRGITVTHLLGLRTVTNPGDSVELVFESEGEGCTPLRFRDCLGKREDHTSPIKSEIVQDGSPVAPILVDGELCFTTSASFVRGDANQDGATTIADTITVLMYLFEEGDDPYGNPVAACPDAADVNDDGGVDIADPIYLLEWLFHGFTEPSAPLSVCGSDPTPDSLGCLSFLPCR